MARTSGGAGPRWNACVNSAMPAPAAIATDADIKSAAQHIRARAPLLRPRQRGASHTNVVHQPCAGVAACDKPVNRSG